MTLNCEEDFKKFLNDLITLDEWINEKTSCNQFMQREEKAIKKRIFL